MKEANLVEDQISELTNKLADKKETIAQSIRGKDATFIIGYTGAGKSTLCAGILGKRLTVVQDQFDQYHIENDGDGQSPKIAKNILDSETKDLYIAHIDKNQVLIDCPGFCDTRGYEMDILNCQSIKTAFQQCRSTKIILTISRMTLQQQKYQKIRILVRNMALAFPQIDHSGILICITHANSDLTVKSVRNKFKKILSYLKGKQDSNFPQAQHRLYQLIINECQIDIIKLPDKKGPFTIPEQMKKKVTSNCQMNQSRFNVKGFSFISLESKNKIMNFVNKATEIRSKAESEKADKKIMSVDLKSLNEKLQSRRITPQQAIKQIRYGQQKEGSAFIEVSGVRHSVGRFQSQYKNIFGSIGSILQNLFISITKLVTFLSEKREFYQKTRAIIENFIEIAEKQIKGYQVVIKRLNGLIQLCKTMSS